jgi:hypothetical protein
MDFGRILALIGTNGLKEMRAPVNDGSASKSSSMKYELLGHPSERINIEARQCKRMEIERPGHGSVERPPLRIHLERIGASGA